MSRRPAPVEDDLQCLLCGTAVEPFWHPVLEETVAYDLCPRCAGAFQAAANRVATWYAAPAVVQVPGQLALRACD